MPAKDGSITEAEFTSQVIDLFRLHGWMVCHIRPAKTAKGWRTPYQGDAGLPDIIASCLGRTVMIELKVGRNKPTRQQREWIDASGGMVAYPGDWEELVRIASFQEGGRHGQTGIVARMESGNRHR